MKTFLNNCIGAALFLGSLLIVAAMLIGFVFLCCVFYELAIRHFWWRSALCVLAAVVYLGGCVTLLQVMTKGLSKVSAIN